MSATLEEIEDAFGGPFYKDRRESRACERCGYVRTVRVSFILQHGVESQHLWVRTCAACDAEARSRHYARESKRFAGKAAELRARQALAAQKRAIGKKR